MENGLIVKFCLETIVQLALSHRKAPIQISKSKLKILYRSKWILHLSRLVA